MARQGLPTEAKWEFAARVELDSATYAWGEELTPAGKHGSNTWQGVFASRNLTAEGHERAAPMRIAQSIDNAVCDVGLHFSAEGGPAQR